MLGPTVSLLPPSFVSVTVFAVGVGGVLDVVLTIGCGAVCRRFADGVLICHRFAVEELIYTNLKIKSANLWQIIHKIIWQSAAIN